MQIVNISLNNNLYSLNLHSLLIKYNENVMTP